MTTLRGAIATLVLGVSMVAGASDIAFNKGADAYVAKKYGEAFLHWSQAAAHGNVTALNNLAYLLYNGYGVEKSEEKATDLWRTAAYAGHSEAQWHLGDAYEFGRGVKKDMAKAHAWYRCAVASAKWKISNADNETEKTILKDAEKSAKGLSPLLTKQELARSDELTAECIQRYGRPAL